METGNLLLNINLANKPSSMEQQAKKDQKNRDKYKKSR
jgi:hypothetical protein